MNQLDEGREMNRREMRRHAETDWIGIVIGIAVFALGIALLVTTFARASALFGTPARVALGADLDPDLTQVAISSTQVLLNIGLLLVMSIVGSVISGKGIRMYLAARTLFRDHPEHPTD